MRIMRESFSSNAEEIIAMIEKYDVKYISVYDTMSIYIALHTSGTETIVFESAKCDYWTYSLSITDKDLQKICNHYDIKEPQVDHILYPVTAFSRAYNPLVDCIHYSDCDRFCRYNGFCKHLGYCDSDCEMCSEYNECERPEKEVI